MRHPKKSILALFALLALGASPVLAQTAPSPSGTADSRYVDRIAPAYAGFAGSRANLESLATGLRHGTAITLTEPGQASVTFTPPTRPMGYGNITRSLDLASRRLAADGITDPTPTQLHGAMNEVLQLRASGMGWGQVAHAIGVFPSGHANAKAISPAPSSAGITTAAGGRGVVYGHSAAGRASGSGRAPGLARTAGVKHTGVQSAAGGVATAGQGNGKALGHARSGK
jgi:hypothetical protein